MSISSYNPRNRYRARAVQRFNRTLGVCVLIAVCVMIGFVWGRHHAANQLDELQTEVTAKAKLLEDSRNEAITQRADARTAAQRYDQLKSQYEKDIPASGPLRDLVEMVKQQVKDGMPAERLAFVIRSTRPPSNCSDPSSKRFVVQTPAYKGPSSTVSVGEGAVLISGKGQSARGKAGEMEAWYDPTQPVTIHFKTGDGREEDKVGTLPFQHAIISQGREYRFNVSEGEKSFAKVSFDSCDYP